jgi:MFS family permease
MKGYIFFAWALVQRITPFFTGGFTDKIGYKKTLLISFFVIVLSYIIMGTQTEFWIFIFGIMLLGFGSGIFLPALQASLTTTLNKENESTAWGIYFMLINLGVFFSPFFSIYFKGISWQFVFFGSAILFAINFLILFFVKFEKVEIEDSEHSVLSEIFSNFFKKEVLVFVLIMSGFIMIYMQFYETFPNFFIDWIDTTALVSVLHLPESFVMTTARGNILSYEIIRLINSGLIILAIVPLSWFMSKFMRINGLLIGIVLATFGLVLCGFSMTGSISIFGILIYTFGEMIVNPKFVEQMNSLAKKGKKALYMSYLNISFAIGLGGGALLGGYIYNYYGEKAYLASNYLKEHFNIQSNDLTQSMNLLVEKTGLTHQQATDLLWNVYNPWMIWLPFAGFGVLAIVGLYFYKKMLKVGR